MFPKSLATKSLVMVVGTYQNDREEPFFGACYEYVDEYHREGDWGPDADMEIRAVTEHRFAKDGDAMYAILDAFRFWTSPVW